MQLAICMCNRVHMEATESKAICSLLIKVVKECMRFMHMSIT